MIRTKLGQNHTDFFVLGIRYPAESGHQLSGEIRYPVKIAIRYIPSCSASDLLIYLCSEVKSMYFFCRLIVLYFFLKKSFIVQTRFEDLFNVLDSLV